MYAGYVQSWSGVTRIQSSVWKQAFGITFSTVELRIVLGLSPSLSLKKILPLTCNFQK